jgi:hypothetical protein
MSIFLSLHYSIGLRGDGLLPELAALLERPIPKVAEPVDALADSEAPFQPHKLRQPPRRI